MRHIRKPEYRLSSTFFAIPQLTIPKRYFTLAAMTLEQAIRHFRGKSALANALGRKPSTVSTWIKRGGIPIEVQCLIEVCTRGRLLANRSELPRRA